MKKKKIIITCLTFCISITFIFFILRILYCPILPESKESAFKRYVLPEIPPGIIVTKKGGYVSLAGGNEWLFLKLFSDSYKQIIEEHDMKIYEYMHTGKLENQQDFAYKTAIDEGIIPFYYYTDSEPGGSSWKIFLLNKDYSKGLFYRGRL